MNILKSILFGLWRLAIMFGFVLFFTVAIYIGICSPEETKAFLISVFVTSGFGLLTLELNK